MKRLERLRRGLVVSCQPVDEGPMDSPQIVAAMARAAEAGGASGFRIEGLENLAAVRSVTTLPIIGIVKHDLPDSPVRITPHLTDVEALADLGADIIAYDATDRPRPCSRTAILAAIRGRNCLAMADCATLEDAKVAAQGGAEILGSTLSGYAYEIAEPDAGPDFEMIAGLGTLGRFVMGEGRYNSPELAGQAIAAGADCVTVGSAVTRIEHITGWFAAAVRAGDRG